MKANELMIGDWASLSETEDIVPCVVTALHPQDLFVIQPGESAGDVLSYDTIYPIPLTAEILEKNGFAKNFSERYTKAIVPFEVNIHGNNKYITLGGNWFCNCDYVHKLQRALRCCELNDLADNFKI